jgi:hypothetical protein
VHAALLGLSLITLGLGRPARAGETRDAPSAEPAPAGAPAVDAGGEPAGAPTAEPAAAAKSGWKRLSDKYDVWIDPQRNAVAVGGEVCLREGQLEMFACLKGTKEHESVVTLNTRAYVVHAALLAVGAKVGHPVRFDPTYAPATGTVIDVDVLWLDNDGKRHQARAQDWIRYVKTGEPMPYSWVFAGSGFWVDDQTGERQYYAEGGDVICVSNFTTATLDLPIESSQENVDLLFEACTENIPPIGTKIRLLLRPRLEQPDAPARQPAGGTP